VLEERLAKHLTSRDLMAVVVERDDAAVAFALLSPRASVWYAGQVAILDELYVVPGLRGRGIGGRLLAFVEEHLVASGFGCLEINVDGDDVDARRFYERHGYRNQEPGESDPMYYYYRELLD
jgi:GNAT superfamily N-acetyltransferase